VKIPACAALVAALALALAPAAAVAQSARHGSFEVGATTYRPNVDSEFGTAQPYRDIFGGGRKWAFRLGIAKSLFTGFGSLEVGFRTGYFRDSGKGLLQSDGTPSGDKTTFNIIPTSAMLTYRFDWLAEHVGIPLAPYGRVAFERYNWWVTDGDGLSEKGATNGWSATAGIAFLLDFLERDTALALDDETGINHTYIYFDATKSWIDDFGSSKSWDLSDESISLSAGLLFAF
jgi:hypothetical protein